MRRNALQYVNDRRVQCAIDHQDELIVDLNTFIKVIKFAEEEEGFDKLGDVNYDLQTVSAELKERLGWDYFLMIEELIGLFVAYSFRKQNKPLMV